MIYKVPSLLQKKTVLYFGEKRRVEEITSANETKTIQRKRLFCIFHGQLSNQDVEKPRQINGSSFCLIFKHV